MLVSTHVTIVKKLYITCVCVCVCVGGGIHLVKIQIWNQVGANTHNDRKDPISYVCVCVCVCVSVCIYTHLVKIQILNHAGANTHDDREDSKPQYA